MTILGCNHSGVNKMLLMDDEGFLVDSEYKCEGDNKDSIVEISYVGENVKEEVNVALTYKGMVASGAWHVIVSDSVEYPTIEVDRGLMPYLSLRTEEDVLVASYKVSVHYHDRSLTPPILRIPAKVSLTEIVLGGASLMESDLPLKGDSLKIEMAGASKADLDVTGIVKLVEVEMAGANNVLLNCNVENLSVEIGGTGLLGLKGKAKVADLELAGVGKVMSEETDGRYAFEADVANIEMAGTSKLELHCNDELNVEAVGAGQISYSGNPRISKSAVGFVKMKQVK